MLNIDSRQNREASIQQHFDILPAFLAHHIKERGCGVRSDQRETSSSFLLPDKEKEVKLLCHALQKQLLRRHKFQFQGEQFGINARRDVAPIVFVQQALSFGVLIRAFFRY